MAATLNVILMGVGLVSVIPLVKSFLPIPDEPDVSIVRIGFGGLNASVPAPDNPSGLLPYAALYDVRGETIGLSDTAAIHVPSGGFGDRKIVSTITPEYIRITAASEDPICISYISMTAASGDLRVWGAGNAKECGIPWYPSPDIRPKADFRPPCFWMSTNPDKVPSRTGLSWKMTDFAPEDRAKGQALALQWRDDPSTLCRAPARQQFWKSLPGIAACVPFYLNELQYTEEGNDLDRDYIINGNVQNCDSAGIPDNQVSLFTVSGKRVVDPNAPYTPDPRFPQAKPPVIPPGTELSDHLDLGTLGKRRDGRVFARAASLEHEKCANEVVISEIDGVSAREVCESSSSWGPDIVSIPEGLYCDMCSHELYKICSSQMQTSCWDVDRMSFRASPRRTVGRDESSAYPEEKRFSNVHRWR